MSDLLDEIAAFENMKDLLETKYLGKWVIFQNEKFVGDFESFEDAAAEAVSRFGRGPYLIREVGAAPMTLPASVLYRPVYAT